MTQVHVLRRFLDAADDLPDPIERLAFADALREAAAEVLTSIYERACFDAKLADRRAEALETTGMSGRAFDDYARRHNGRFGGAERVRWNDPLRPGRRESVPDLTDALVAPPADQVPPIRRKRRPHPAQKP